MVSVWWILLSSIVCPWTISPSPRLSGRRTNGSQPYLKFFGDSKDINPNWNLFETLTVHSVLGTVAQSFTSDLLIGSVLETFMVVGKKFSAVSQSLKSSRRHPTDTCKWKTNFTRRRWQLNKMDFCAFVFAADLSVTAHRRLANVYRWCWTFWTFRLRQLKSDELLKQRLEQVFIFVLFFSRFVSKNLGFKDRRKSQNIALTRSKLRKLFKNYEIAANVKTS